MKRTMVMVLLMGLALAACTTVKVATPRPEFRMAQEATQMAFEVGATQTADAQVAGLILADIHAQGTLAAAQGTAEAVAALRTGTAQAAQATATQGAIYANATATERAWVATQQAWSATATADSAKATSTACADGTATAQAAVWTQAAVDLQHTAEAASVVAMATAQAANAGIAAENLAQEQIATQRADFVKYAWAVAPLVLLAIGVAAGLWGFKVMSSVRPIQRDANGMAPVMVIDGKVMIPDRAVFPVMDPRNPLLAPVNVQARIAENDQKVQALRQLGAGKGTKPATAMRLMTPSETPAAPVVIRELPQQADWRALAARPNGRLLLGAGEAGLVTARQDTPHVLLAGQTGSGKSTGMKSIITQHLLDGRRVTILDKSGRDFGVFDDLATVITLDASNPNQAISELIGYLQAAWVEVLRRQRESRPTWKGITDVLVVDELDNWQDITMDSRTAPSRLWQFPRMISKEGRASGVYLLAASQNPTAQSIDIGMRRNCTPVAYRLADRAASQIIISANDAVGLPTGQFIAALENNVHGVGFNPSDDEIRATLQGVRPLGRAEWLDAEPMVLEPAPQAREMGESWQDKARRLHEEGLAISRVARMIGRNYYDTQAAILEGAEAS